MLNEVLDIMCVVEVYVEYDVEWTPMNVVVECIPNGSACRVDPFWLQVGTGLAQLSVNCSRGTMCLM